MSRQLDAFVTEVEGAWHRPVVFYVGDDWRAAYPVRSDRARWSRRISRRPTGEWRIWQASFDATVDGIDGGVDLDVVRQP